MSLSEPRPMKVSPEGFVMWTHTSPRASMPLVTAVTENSFRTLVTAMTLSTALKAASTGPVP